MQIIFRLIAAAGVAGCTVLTPLPTVGPAADIGSSTSRQAVDFAAVIRRIEPVSERICRQNAPDANCNFRIFVDDRAGQPANAYQRLDQNGRPELGVTLALISQAHNADELAFVLSHEAAHHISGHLAKTQNTALAGAVLGGLLAALVGGNASDVDLAQNLGGTVGARAYSKGFELEADQLGTLIAFRAGYDPLNGAQFFDRIPDPGDQFLGTHPPNSARISVVRQTIAGLS